MRYNNPTIKDVIEVLENTVFFNYRDLPKDYFLEPTDYWHTYYILNEGIAVGTLWIMSSFVDITIRGTLNDSPDFDIFVGRFKPRTEPIFKCLAIVDKGAKKKVNYPDMGF